MLLRDFSGCIYIYINEQSLFSGGGFQTGKQKPRGFWLVGWHLRTSQKMILFWGQKLVEWHEDVPWQVPENTGSPRPGWGQIPTCHEWICRGRVRVFGHIWVFFLQRTNEVRTKIWWFLRFSLGFVGHLLQNGCYFQEYGGEMWKLFVQNSWKSNSYTLGGSYLTVLKGKSLFGIYPF